MMIVILGPDGCGKSSVIEQITAELTAQFAEIEYVHLRPALHKTKAGESKREETQPHQQAPYSPLISLLKIIYLWMVYNVGYCLNYSQFSQANHLLIFDRYFHDILIDPLRFRYAGPVGLAKFLSKYIPQPDLFILLDAPADILQQRKQEVSYAETARQCQAYQTLIKTLPQAICIDASRSIPEVRHALTSAILERRAG